MATVPSAVTRCGHCRGISDLRSADLSKKGCFVTNSRKHPVVYEERIGKEIAVVPIPTVMIDEGTYDVIVPSRAEWEKSAPDWASIGLMRYSGGLSRHIPKSASNCQRTGPLKWGQPFRY
jgi:hypothetical protein